MRERRYPSEKMTVGGEEESVTVVGAGRTTAATLAAERTESGGLSAAKDSCLISIFRQHLNAK